MPQHEVVLRNEMGMRVPSIPKVPVSAGGQIKFTAAADADSSLYFSPKTAANLSPRPQGRVDVAAGQSVTFTFDAQAAGTVVAQAPGDPHPHIVEAAENAVLTIRAGSGVSFPVTTNPPGTGG